MKMTLSEVKKEMVIAVGLVGERLKALIDSEEDCFGRQWSSTSKECEICTISTLIRGARRPLWVFCCQLTQNGELELSEEVEKIMGMYRQFRDEGRSDHEWAEYLYNMQHPNKKWNCPKRLLRVEEEII